MAHALNLKGVNLYLIGMMGAGKTTVGRLLAQQLTYRFFDTDALVEHAARQSVSQIFAEVGESGFRRLETQVLAELSAHKNLAIATGGGIVLEQMNWSYLQHGIVVWLDVPVDELYNRLKSDTTRPLLKDADLLAKLRRILAQRQHLYAQADVHVRISVNDTAEHVTAQVVQKTSKVLRQEVLRTSVFDQP